MYMYVDPETTLLSVTWQNENNIGTKLSWVFTSFRIQVEMPASLRTWTSH